MKLDHPCDMIGGKKSLTTIILGFVNRRRVKGVEAQEAMSIPHRGVEGNFVTLVITQQIGEWNNLPIKQRMTHVIRSMSARAEMCINATTINDGANLQESVIMNAQMITAAINIVAASVMLINNRASIHIITNMIDTIAIHIIAIEMLQRDAFGGGKHTKGRAGDPFIMLITRIMIRDIRELLYTVVAI